MKLNSILLAGAVLFTASAAQAQTYTETLDLPAYGSAGPRVLQSSSAFTSGTKLTADDEISNPSGWNNALDVSLDTTAQTITLTGDGYNGYQTIDFDLTGVTGFKFTSLTPITPYGATDSDGYPYGFETSFTGSSLHIGYAAENIAAGDYFEINPGSSVFAYTTSATTGAVPEPATWAMMLVGFGMVGFGLRYSRKQSVRVTFA